MRSCKCLIKLPILLTYRRKKNIGAPVPSRLRQGTLLRHGWLRRTSRRFDTQSMAPCKQEARITTDSFAPPCGLPGDRRSRGGLARLDLNAAERLSCRIRLRCCSVINRPRAIARRFSTTTSYPGSTLGSILPPKWWCRHCRNNTMNSHGLVETRSERGRAPSHHDRANVLRNFIHSNETALVAAFLAAIVVHDIFLHEHAAL